MGETKNSEEDGNEISLDKTNAIWNRRLHLLLTKCELICSSSAAQ